MIKGGNEGSKVLLGTIKLINMIPIPTEYVLDYSIEDESDLKYKDVVSDEFKWVSENRNKITKNARLLYFSRKTKSRPKTIAIQKFTKPSFLFKK